MGQPQGHNAERKTPKNVFCMIVYMHFISCISVKKNKTAVISGSRGWGLTGKGHGRILQANDNVWIRIWIIQVYMHLSELHMATHGLCISLYKFYLENSQSSKRKIFLGNGIDQLPGAHIIVFQQWREQCGRRSLCLLSLRPAPRV